MVFLSQKKNLNVLLDFFGTNKFLGLLKLSGGVKDPFNGFLLPKSKWCGWGNPAWFPISSQRIGGVHERPIGGVDNNSLFLYDIY